MYSYFGMLFGLLLFEKRDQRNCIKFCVKNEIKYARTFEMLTLALDESTMSRTQVQLWYNRFKEGQEDVNDEARSGRLSLSTIDENIETVKKMIWIIVESLVERFLMILAYRSTYVKQFLRIF